MAHPSRGRPARRAGDGPRVRGVEPTTALPTSVLSILSGARPKPSRDSAQGRLPGDRPTVSGLPGLVRTPDEAMSSESCQVRSVIGTIAPGDPVARRVRGP